MNRKKRYNVTTKDVKIAADLHAQLKRIASDEGTFLQDQFENAVKFYLKHRNDQQITQFSSFVELLDEFKRLEDRLAGMIAKMGISTETGLELLLDALTRNNPQQRERVYQDARKRGVKRFATRLEKREDSDQ